MTMAAEGGGSPRWNILLVEDNPGDVALAREAFTALGRSNVQVVTNGVDARTFLSAVGSCQGSPRPDLVLLDLNLPGIDGREMLAWLKNHSELRSIPVIVMTGSDDRKDIRESYDLHANCVITKPRDATRLERIAEAILDLWCAVDDTSRVPSR